MALDPPGDATATGIGSTAPIQDAYSRKWVNMMVVAVGTFMSTLDASIVNISLPTITQALSTNLASVQWVVTAYFLTITSLLLVFGRLGDIRGRKPIYVTGFALFTVASGLCGLVQSIEQLIVLRAIQGAGAAMVMSISPAIITASFPPSERGKGLGINSSIVATGLSTGPTLGGLLIRWMDWRAVFFARVPVGILGVAMALFVLREPPLPRRKQRFDLLGAALLSLSLSSLLLGLNRAQQGYWPSPLTTGYFSAFVLLFAAFLVVESRISAPMLDLSLFRRRLFSASLASSVLNFQANAGTTFLLPFLLAGVLGFGPSQVGLIMTASPLTIIALATLSGSLSDRIGSRWISSLGLCLCSTALVLLSGLDATATAADVVPRLVLLGTGIGLFQAPNNNSIMSSVPRDRLGTAAGMLATMRNLGMALGVAIAGAAYSSRFGHYSAGLGPEASDAALTAASVSAFHDAFLLAAFLAGIGIFTSLVRGHDRPKRDQQAAPGQ